MLDTKALGLPSLAAIGITVAVALIVFLVVWSLSSSSQPATRSPPPAQQWSPEPVSTEAKERWSQVKVETSRAAASIRKASEQGDREALSSSLLELRRIYDAQAKGGHDGVIALTEFCNALLTADAVDTLHGLQSDADPNVSRQARELFEAVVPRIWSC